MTAPGPEHAEGEVVRTILDLVLDLRGRFGRTVAVIWACTACGDDHTAPDIATAMTSFGNHLFAHHHRGAVLGPRHVALPSTGKG